MLKYLKLRNDYMFKKALGQNNNMLIPLLRHLIPERKIKSIQFQNTEQVSSRKDGKMPRYDIICTDEDGASFIVELQCVQYEDYFDRVLIYSSFQLSGSLKRGEAYANARPVYVISIIDYLLSMEKDTDVSRNQLLRYAHVFLDDNNAKPLSCKLIFIFLQLPTVSGITKHSTWLEKFAYLVRNSEKFTEIPEELKSEDYFVDILSRADKANMKKRDWQLYDHMERDERERQACIDFARKEGLAEGRAEGRLEGRAEGRLEGRAEGRLEGREEGRVEGREEGRMEVFSQMAAVLGISLEDVMAMAGSMSQKI